MEHIERLIHDEPMAMFILGGLSVTSLFCVTLLIWSFLYRRAPGDVKWDKAAPIPPPRREDR